MVMILLFILKIVVVISKDSSHPACDCPILSSTIYLFIGASQSLFQGIDYQRAFIKFSQVPIIETW